MENPFIGENSVRFAGRFPQRAFRKEVCYTGRMTRLLSMTALLWPTLAFAQGAGSPDATLTVNIGTNAPLMSVLTGLSTILVAGMVPVTAAIVTVGGIMIAAAHGNDSWTENGKKAVMGGLIGFCIVMGSYGILRMIVNFIYF